MINSRSGSGSNLMPRRHHHPTTPRHANQTNATRAHAQGSGTGVCGMFLAAAGARVVLTDLPHITPLTRQNVALNCGGGGAAGAPFVVEYAWGEQKGLLKQRIAAAAAIGAVSCQPAEPQQQQQQQLRSGMHSPAGASSSSSYLQTSPDQIEFDLIVGADLLYEPATHLPLLQSLRELASPHTQVRSPLCRLAGGS